MLKEMLAILSTRERRNLVLVLVVMIFMGFVEMIGVGSIMPFLAVAAEPSLISENEYLRWAYDAFGFESTRSFLFTLGIGVILAIIIRNGFHGLSSYIQVRFTSMRNHTLSNRLFTKYLYQPYVFFLNQNSSNLSRNFLAEVQSVIRGIYVPTIDLVAKGIISVSITLLLFIVNPILALIVIVFLGGLYGGTFLLVKRKIKRIGRERLDANRERYKIAAESFGGIKDVKLLGKEDVFLRQYSRHSRRLANYDTFESIIESIPHFVLESVLFGGMMIVVLYLLMQSGSINEVLPVIGLYAFAGYRIMPSLKTMFNAITKLRYHRAALDLLYNDLCLEAGDEPSGAGNDIAPLAFEHTIELAGIEFKYPGSTESVIKGQSLAIRKNTTIAFVGATGCGKTTIVDILLGLLQPQGGEMRVDDVPIDNGNRRAWQKNLGYVPQHIYLSDDTIARNIAFGIPNDRIDQAAVEQAAKIANLHDFIANDLPGGYDTIVGERGVRLSGGQRQRIGIARALYHDPSVLILDEATSALDGITENAIMDAISNLTHEKTIVMIAHRLTTVKDCDAIYMMERGRIIDKGSYEDLMSRNERFRNMAKA